MLPSLTMFCLLMVGGAPVVQSTCQQVAPVPINGKWVRSVEQMQAVVLIHGFQYRTFDRDVPKATFRPWQQPDSALVKVMGKHADVFVFAYGQNVSLDIIVKESNLGDTVDRLRKLGYRDIVLIGHSAGGLIARQFVEDYPDAGVTKVLQVCTPNGGSPWASLPGHRSQKVFRHCLTEEGRQECLKARADKRIPANVQFVCVVGKANARADTDSVVPCDHQWTADLQKQGIPAVSVLGIHQEVVRSSKIAVTLAGLLHDNHERWTSERIARARKEILGK